MLCYGFFPLLRICLLFAFALTKSKSERFGKGSFQCDFWFLLIACLRGSWGYSSIVGDTVYSISTARSYFFLFTYFLSSSADSSALSCCSSIVPPYRMLPWSSFTGMAGVVVDFPIQARRSVSFCFSVGYPFL